MSDAGYKYFREFQIGRRIELRPHFDLWMMGARYGTVKNVTRKGFTIKLDKWKKPISGLQEGRDFSFL